MNKTLITNTNSQVIKCCETNPHSEMQFTWTGLLWLRQVSGVLVYIYRRERNRQIRHTRYVKGHEVSKRVQGMCPSSPVSFEERQFVRISSRKRVIQIEAVRQGFGEWGGGSSNETRDWKNPFQGLLTWRQDQLSGTWIRALSMEAERQESSNSSWVLFSSWWVATAEFLLRPGTSYWGSKMLF